MGGKCLGVTVVASRNDKRVDSCVHNNVECSCICFYFKIDLDALCWGCIGLWWILARKLRRRQGWLDEISREDCFLVIFYTILYYPYHRISPPSSFGTPHSSCGPPFHCICTKESLPCSDRNGDYCRRCPNNNNKRARQTTKHRLPNYPSQDPLSTKSRTGGLDYLGQISEFISFLSKGMEMIIIMPKSFNYAKHTR